MKKISIALFIIGALLMIVDVNNMAMFFGTKVLGILCILPAYLTFDIAE